MAPAGVQRDRVLSSVWSPPGLEKSRDAAEGSGGAADPCGEREVAGRNHARPIMQGKGEGSHPSSWHVPSYVHSYM